MTSFAMMIGLLPMMFAFGVGANGNRTLGSRLGRRYAYRYDSADVRRAGAVCRIPSAAGEIQADRMGEIWITAI